MTPNRVSAIAFRWSISAVFTLYVFAPKAHAQTSATGTPQPVAGTTVVVRMIDAVDSGSDPAGKQYRASVASPVNAGNNITIAQGSVATITLVRNASGWAARLTSLFINGRVTPTDSSLAALAGTAPHSLDNDVAVLTGHASGTSTVPGLAAIASGARIILPAGTSLSFALNAPAANGPAPANPAQANASALTANRPGKSYFCQFNDTVQRPNVTHYFSGVFEADASQIEVSKAWTNYIRQKYLPGDNRDSGGCQIGTADQQQRVETTLRQTWQVMATGAERAGMKIPTNTVVDVSWKYVPDHPTASSAAGTPPSTAAASVAPPATASAAPAAKPSAAAAAGQGVPAQAQKQQGGGWWWYCSAGPYMTGVFFYPTDINMRADVDAAIQTAWSNYTRSKYPTENLGTGCTLGFADQASTQRIHDHMRASYKGGEVVDVDWKYVPGQDTPPVALVANYYCFAAFDQNSQNNYASGLYAGSKLVNTVIMAKDFAQFVKEKYQSGEKGEKVTGSCYNAVIDRAVAEAGKVSYEARWRSGKWIETGWKPTTTPVASGEGKPYYCFGYNVNKALYFSDTFEVPPNTPANPVINGFAQFLTEKYGVSSRTGWDGGIRCSWGDKAKFVPEPGMTGYKIVETGWKPTSLPPPYVGP